MTAKHLIGLTKPFVSITTTATLTVTMLLASNAAWSAANGANKPQKQPKISLNEAREVVSDYQELRDSCMEGSYDQRRACLSELSKANPQYRQAKRVIEQFKFEQTPQSTLSLR